MKPFALGANQLRRFYRGGASIAAFRGLPGDDAGPEDWVASTTAVHGDGDVGLSRLADGTLLRDLIAADPDAFLGPTHVAAYGSDLGVLVKLLDAGERLPLHLHPDDAFARAELGTRYGKTEAWIILEASPGAHVHVGFAREIGDDELTNLVAAQDVDAMVEAMNRLPVSAGDSIFVPAGLAHVIGEGIFLLELQEPSDLSLLLEWKGLMDEAEAFLGLSRKLALTAVTRSRLSHEELERMTSNRGAAFFPSEADRFFRADRIEGESVLEPSFSILVVLDGSAMLDGASFESVPLRRGSTVVVPFAAGSTCVTGTCAAIRCRPPRPS
jgi:mannose-6-phosphate isomerase